jgi:hypothetical protein
MLPLVEPKWNYSSVLDTHWESFVTLKNPNEIPESWLTAVSHYAQKLNRWSYNLETKQGEHTIREKGLASMIQREAYRAAKPFDVEPVPLGELSYDSYRNWVNN